VSFTFFTRNFEKTHFLSKFFQKTKAKLIFTPLIVYRGNFCFRQTQYWLSKDSKVKKESWDSSTENAKTLKVEMKAKI